ncbi:MAG: alpha/beta hydrolase, partial [Actinomycetes bacterium]
MSPTVVLLHAFPLNKSLFDEVTSPIAETGWDVIVPDLRGFGESGFGGVEPDDEPSLAFMARDVLDIMDRVGVQSAVIAGVSLGGYVAMELVRQAPERIAALALIDTKGSADSSEARDNRLRVAEQVSSAESTEALGRAMLPNLLGATTHEQRPAVVELVRSWIHAADPEGVAWAQRAMAARPDSYDDLASLRVPS